MLSHPFAWFRVVSSFLSCFGCPLACCAVVIRSSLVPFACATRNGLSTLSAEPSIFCSAKDARYNRMRAVGALSIGAYGLGLPLLFAWLLLKHRRCERKSCMGVFVEIL